MLTLLLLSALASLSFSMPDSLTASFKDDSMKNRIVKHYEREMTINGSPEEVFAFMDAIQQGKQDPIEFESIVRTTKLSFKVIESLITGLPQPIE